MLPFAIGLRPEDEEETGATTGRLRGCDEDKLPTKEATLYCEAFNKDPDACRANGCRSLDLMTATGALVCKAACQTASTAAATAHFPDLTDSPVPQAVKDAVQAARELVQAKATAAESKVQEAKIADEGARAAMVNLKTKQEEAAANLRQAEESEAQAKAAAVSMESAIAAAKETDANLNALTSAYEAALGTKEAAKADMSSKLKAKQEQEAIWKAADHGLRDEMDEVKQEIRSLEEKLAAIKQTIENKNARIRELGKMRAQNSNTRKTTGKDITKVYMASLDAYKAEKAKVEELAESGERAEAANTQAEGSAQSAVMEYWQKVEEFRSAADQRTTAESMADEAQTEYLEAQFALAQVSAQMTDAAQEHTIFEALRDKIEGVYEYAKIFYNKLYEVQQPEGNPMMAVMNLVKDPAMKPCLSSYNVVITAANDIGQTDQTEIMATLKTGLIQIDADRFNRFKAWIWRGKEEGEDFKYWIWGANELEQVELAI